MIHTNITEVRQFRMIHINITEVHITITEVRQYRMIHINITEVRQYRTIHNLSLG
ncbi:hypothetical protein DPMN_188397 [Dreissena polymorpha]|uniref:Uncharacterized protein n=1 Tax=Dreissena polymorpha TaxID=45954 RepID=A0A9D4DR76_DREPO|nr:hypothetical protein DPMN_188397 [Dreissena polymorpha]